MSGRSSANRTVKVVAKLKKRLKNGSAPGVFDSAWRDDIASRDVNLDCLLHFVQGCLKYETDTRIIVTFHDIGHFGDREGYAIRDVSLMWYPCQGQILDS